MMMMHEQNNRLMGCLIWIVGISFYTFFRQLEEALKANRNYNTAIQTIWSKWENNFHKNFWLADI